jgi:hypothetical protein
MAIAMTIGASKIKILQESALASMSEEKKVNPHFQKEGSASDLQESCFT